MYCFIVWCNPGDTGDDITATIAVLSRHEHTYVQIHASIADGLNTCWCAHSCVLSSTLDFACFSASYTCCCVHHKTPGMSHLTFDRSVHSHCCPHKNFSASCSSDFHYAWLLQAWSQSLLFVKSPHHTLFCVCFYQWPFLKMLTWTIYISAGFSVPVGHCRLFYPH